MPISKSKLDQFNAMLDQYLEQREKDRLASVDDDDEDDPVQFLDPEETRRTGPIAEPPVEPQEDCAPQRIHGAGRKDLFR
jgi:hypothetical protein